MFFDEARRRSAAGAPLALAALIGVFIGCHERIVVGTEPNDERRAALPPELDAGPGDVTAPPDAEAIESDEDDDEGAVGENSDDEDAQDEDAPDDTEDSGDED